MKSVYVRLLWGTGDWGRNPNLRLMKRLLLRTQRCRFDAICTMPGVAYHDLEVGCNSTIQRSNGGAERLHCKRCAAHKFDRVRFHTVTDVFSEPEQNGCMPLCVTVKVQKPMFWKQKQKLT